MKYRIVPENYGTLFSVEYKRAWYTPWTRASRHWSVEDALIRIDKYKKLKVNFGEPQ